MAVFVDTNVLVYTRDASEPATQRRANSWMLAHWESRSGHVSVQVLNEYYITVTRKLSPAMPDTDARADVRDLQAWNPIPVDTGLIAAAWTIQDRYSLSYWDAFIVAAAQRADCEYLLTEDPQDVQRLDTVTVADLFAHSPATLLR